MYDLNGTTFADRVPEAFDVSCGVLCLVSIITLLVLGVAITIVLLIMVVYEWVDTAFPEVDLSNLTQQQRVEIDLVLRWVGDNSLLV